MGRLGKDGDDEAEDVGASSRMWKRRLFFQSLGMGEAETYAPQ